MGAIARSAANNITTSGVFTSNAITNSSVTGITVLANASDGITLISSQTASASASISFTTGINSTYKAYKFVYTNCHPSIEDNSNGIEFHFNMSTDGGSNYNVTKASTYVLSSHNEADTFTNLNYDGTFHLVQSTAFQILADRTSADNDHAVSGSMILFNPSSTTKVKHFIADTQSVYYDDMSVNAKVSGYGNTTSAVNAIQFKFSAGNIDAGTISMYGIK